MRRRDFTAGLVAAALAPHLARAQRKVPVVGVLWHAANEEEEQVFLTPLREGLRALGYIEGQTVTLEQRFPNEQYELYERMAADLVARKVDVLIAVSPPAANAAKRATSTIPIVFIIHPAPVDSGLVASLSHPGGNITGFSNLHKELSGKQIEILKEVVPTLSRIGIVIDEGFGSISRQFVDQQSEVARRLGLDFETVSFKTADELPQVFATLAQHGVNGVTLAPSSILFRDRAAVAQLGLKHRLPIMGTSEVMARDGMLLWYGPNFQNLFRGAAIYVDRILKGAKPADLPVQQPTKLDLVINLRTAKQFGLAVPPTMLARADEVVE